MCLCSKSHNSFVYHVHQHKFLLGDMERLSERLSILHASMGPTTNSTDDGSTRTSDNKRSGINDVVNLISMINFLMFSHLNIKLKCISSVDNLLKLECSFTSRHFFVHDNSKINITCFVDNVVLKVNFLSILLITLLYQYAINWDHHSRLQLYDITYH